MNLGQKIRYLREKKCISQRRLAKIVDMRASSLTQIEGGKYKPAADILQRLEKYLGVSFDEDIIIKFRCPVMKYGVR